MITFYDFAVFTVRALAYALASKVEVNGLENLPMEGPVVVAPNHLHFADPPLLGAFLPRPIRYMVKQEAWNAPIIGNIVRWYGAFPVRRGEADVGAYRAALKLLKANQVIGLFPEGHRSDDGHLQQLRSGAITLANRTGAPIVPVGMHGVREVMRGPGSFRRFPITINIGKPYHPKSAKLVEMSELTAELTERIGALLPPEYQPHVITPG